ncbi:MAG: very short patch repair endonuclease [Phycisphaerales bacterium]
MADDRTSAQRSETMRRVRGKDTSCELALRRELHRRGLRYRLHARLPGKPDLVFVSARVAVFVDGCFWHGCPQHCRVPATNREYWRRKIARNAERDKAASKALRAEGWRVIRVWEHRVKSPAGLRAAAGAIERVVRGRGGR